MKGLLRFIAVILVIASVLLLSCCNLSEGEKKDEVLGESEGGENLSLEQKWNDLVVNKGAKMICIYDYWMLSSNLPDTKKIDDEKISELLTFFEGITFSRLDETYLPGVEKPVYSLCFSQSSLVIDESGIAKYSDWEKLKDEGLNIIVERDGYVYVITEDGVYKSNLTVDYTEIKEYYNQATEFDIIL